MNEVIDKIEFEWDCVKADSNKVKHAVTFAEAKTVFFDEDARVIFDPDHSTDEDRFILLGLSSISRVLVVCHCYKQENGSVRIISARKATKKESSQYRGNCR
jgi:uncharacterized protein